MDVGSDDLAGVVDLFGSLTRAQLVTALEELAFRHGDSVDPEVLSAHVDDAVDDFYLVAVEDRLVAGPVAFPTLPDGAEDLPHILDAERSAADRAAAAAAAEDRFRSAAAAAAEEGDEDRLAELLDVSYDLEAWGPVDVADARDRLDRELGD